MKKTVKAAVASLVAVGALAATAGPALAQTARPAPAAKVAPCTASALKLQAGTVSRPINHVLITATNTSKKTCDFSAETYPLLRLHKDQQAVTPVIDDSQPQAVVTIAPGEKAYAGLTLSAADSSEKGFKTSRIEVAVAKDTGLKSVTVKGGPVFIQPGAAKVTYWQDNAADALLW
ncbi:hypothetical protein C3486_35865 [Streptomyces sp. Ru73]|uniref:DUF4232 domain-containing protein n=1 Tax=Streptomyces sp. Ru73 TaxID=2080748 RepID=UPI000CDD1268|nr:DUF4232 domain-containing protein [Streptomyces sp. Ru73]POX36001.1 hypothetical protein C3486_35865 [Streptomyces sp. Ru73]